MVQGRWVVSQVAVAGDRLWDADQAFLRRGHGHTYEAGPLGHDIRRNTVARKFICIELAYRTGIELEHTRARVSSLVFIERNVGGPKLNILVT